MTGKKWDAPAAMSAAMQPAAATPCHGILGLASLPLDFAVAAHRDLQPADTHARSLFQTLP
jgi:hypothetical protein